MHANWGRPLSAGICGETLDMADVSINHINGLDTNPASLNEVVQFYERHTPAALLVTSLREPLTHLASFLSFATETKLTREGIDQHCKDGACNHQAHKLGIRSEADLAGE
jgi:hypothetical protein